MTKRIAWVVTSFGLTKTRVARRDHVARTPIVTPKIMSHNDCCYNAEISSMCRCCYLSVDVARSHEADGTDERQHRLNQRAKLARLKVVVMVVVERKMLTGVHRGRRLRTNVPKQKHEHTSPCGANNAPI